MMFAFFSPGDKCTFAGPTAPTTDRFISKSAHFSNLMNFNSKTASFAHFSLNFGVVEGGPPGPEFLGLWSWRSLRPLVWTTALQPRWALGLRVRVGFASVIAVASFVRICFSENTVPQNHSKSNCLLYLLSSFAHLTEL